MTTGNEFKGSVNEQIRIFLGLTQTNPGVGSFVTGDTYGVTSGVLKNRAPLVMILFGANLTWTNMAAAAEEFVANGANNRRTVDLRNYTQWRLHTDLSVAGVAASVIGAQYSLDGGTNWNGLDNGTAATQSTNTQDLTNAGSLITSWVTLHSGARISDVLLRILGSGGDGAVDPVFQIVAIEVR